MKIMVNLDSARGWGANCMFSCEQCRMNERCSHNLDDDCRPIQYMAKRVGNPVLRRGDKKLLTDIDIYANFNVTDAGDVDEMRRLVRRTIEIYIIKQKTK